jgi:hypothetical protein
VISVTIEAFTSPQLARWSNVEHSKAVAGAAILSMFFALRTAMTKECFGLPALLRPDSHEVANSSGNVIETREPGGHAA